MFNSWYYVANVFTTEELPRRNKRDVRSFGPLSETHRTEVVVVSPISPETSDLPTHTEDRNGDRETRMNWRDTKLKEYTCCSDYNGVRYKNICDLNK